MQGKGWAAIGADSRATDNGRIYSLARGTRKVFRNREYLFGIAGDVRAINILQHVFIPPSAKNKTGRALDQLITKEFIPALRICFEEQGYFDHVETEDSNSAAANTDSTIVVLVNGTIFQIDGNYAWSRESSGFYTEGTGSEYAIGALHALLSSKDEIDPETAKAVVRQVLVIAAKLDGGTAGPFIIAAQLAPEAT